MVRSLLSKEEAERVFGKESGDKDLRERSAAQVATSEAKRAENARKKAKAAQLKVEIETAKAAVDRRNEMRRPRQWWKEPIDWDST
jgi:hypothetical protein